MKQAAVIFLIAFISIAQGSAQVQTEERKHTPLDITREVRVKIVYDQFFAKEAESLVTRLGVAPSSKWSARTPEDIAVALLANLSKKYADEFGITLIPIRPFTNIILPRSDLTDNAYASILRQAPCDGANILLGFTGLYLARAKNGELFGEAGNIYTSAAHDPAGGRVFVRLFSEIANPEEALNATMHRLDHEMRHVFGALHPPGVVSNSFEEKLFFEQSPSVILTNRSKPLTCEFTSNQSAHKKEGTP
ncbi:MAG: hypothetical protein Q8Q39_00645 [bacterium]|nr:hypothetical protein [bacterium]